LIGTNPGAIMALDNLSRLSGPRSDALCPLATGSELPERTFYADAGETLIDAQHRMLLTGIEMFLTRGDTVDSPPLVKLEKNLGENRRTAAESASNGEASAVGATRGMVGRGVHGAAQR
jgi:hypothetical protein